MHQSPNASGQSLSRGLAMRDKAAASKAAGVTSILSRFRVQVTENALNEPARGWFFQ